MKLKYEFYLLMCILSLLTACLQAQRNPKKKLKGEKDVKRDKILKQTDKDEEWTEESKPKLVR